MNRRDTIIIALLVNAGLLMVLLITATRSGEKKEKGATQMELAHELPAQQEAPPALTVNRVIDPIDELLGETLMEESEEIVLARVVDTQPAPLPVVQSQAAPVVQEPTTQVTVKNGDFLERIARNHNTTVAAIMKANKLTTTNLRIGQVLNIPAQAAHKTDTQLSPQSSEVEYYTVKDGDSPWLIASKNRVSLEELLRLNHLDEQKARRLRPGDKLRIR